jgi:Fe-S cluster assembly scaffold protein SufB
MTGTDNRKAAQNLLGYISSLRRKSRSELEKKIDNKNLEIPEEIKNIVNSGGEEFSLESGVEQVRQRDYYAERGLVFLTFSEAVEEYPGLVKKYIDQFKTFDSDWPQLFNEVFWNGGYFLYLEPGVQLEEPLVIPPECYSSDGLSAQRLLIVAAEYSSMELTRVSRPLSGRSEKIDFGLTDIIAEAGADVHFTALCRGGFERRDYSTIRSYIERDGRVNIVSGRPAGSAGEPSIYGYLVGERAWFGSREAHLVSGQQNLHNRVKAVHDAPDTVSEMLVRGVAAGESSSFFEGIVEMSSGSEGASGTLREKILQLDSAAAADALPVLRINENDVTAAHSASVGEIDRDKLFYLQSRGLDLSRARRLIIEGFFEFLLETVGCPSVRENLDKIIKDRLDDIDV